MASGEGPAFGTGQCLPGYDNGGQEDTPASLPLRAPQGVGAGEKAPGSGIGACRPC